MLAHEQPAAYGSAAQSFMATCLTLVACNLYILQLPPVKVTLAWYYDPPCLVCDAQQCLLPCLLMSVSKCA